MSYNAAVKKMAHRFTQIFLQEETGLIDLECGDNEVRGGTALFHTDNEARGDGIF